MSIKFNRKIRDKACILHEECLSGFCKNNRCTLPELNDPCNSKWTQSCRQGQKCGLHGRCILNNDGNFNFETCTETNQCLLNHYCDPQKFLCVPRKTEYQKCDNVNDECENGYKCEFNKCVKQCYKDSDCPGLHSRCELPTSYLIGTCKNHVQKRIEVTKPRTKRNDSQSKKTEIPPQPSNQQYSKNNKNPSQNQHHYYLWTAGGLSVVLIVAISILFIFIWKKSNMKRKIIKQAQQKLEPEDLPPSYSESLGNYSPKAKSEKDVK